MDQQMPIPVTVTKTNGRGFTFNARIFRSAHEYDDCTLLVLEGVPGPENMVRITESADTVAHLIRLGVLKGVLK